jgi:SAM-dependent methyltransferase
MTGPMVPGEVVISPVRPGEFLVSNPSTRTHAVGDSAFLELLASSSDPPGEVVRVCDASRPPFEDGLLEDPSGLDRSVTLEGADAVSPQDALALARRLMLVVDDPARYREYLTGRRLNVIDRGHHGNLHQRVGEYVLMRLRRSSVDDWWVEQKFTDDRREPRAGLYRDVQWQFATAYYAQAGLAGERILDFGCGPGLFSRLFAHHGATVLGLDINGDHLETARRLAREDGLADRCEFRELALPVEDGLAPLAEERFDRIFLSDVLMFYFHPYDPGLELDPVALMRCLAGLLAPEGRIEILEPNGVFWQQPWLGDTERPFTILTEYRHRHFGVTPTLEQISRTAEAAGLAITRIRELAASAEAAEADADRGLAFAAEFPPWWFFELRRRA